MTTRELMQLADMVGDMAAGLAFFSERAGNRHRDTLAKLRQQAELVDQAEDTIAPQLPAPPTTHTDTDMDVEVSGFQFPPPPKRTPKHAVQEP